MGHQWDDGTKKSQKAVNKPLWAIENGDLPPI
jgi:hypothetical protein